MMSENRPPPLPPQALNYQTPGQPARPAPPAAGNEAYQNVADTVGMVPSLRWKDNLIQAACILLGAVLGAAITFFATGNPGFAVLGGIGGIVAALFISGIVLMFLGWRRAARFKRERGRL